jgi:hypothetical protein
MATKETAVDTLALLEERIRRIDYLLNGDNAAHEDEALNNASATARLRHLEHRLASLVARSPPAADILTLQRAHPAVFNPSQATTAPALPAGQLAQLLLAHTPLFTTTAANLTQLQSQSSIPDPQPFIKVLQLQERIEKARQTQVGQAKEFAELRQRSANLVEMWYEVGVLGMGENWAEWEERVREVEIWVRRAEAGRRREEGVV